MRRFSALLHFTLLQCLSLRGDLVTNLSRFSAQLFGEERRVSIFARHCSAAARASSFLYGFGGFMRSTRRSGCPASQPTPAESTQTNGEAHAKGNVRVCVYVCVGRLTSRRLWGSTLAAHTGFCIRDVCVFLDATKTP